MRLPPLLSHLRYPLLPVDARVPVPEESGLPPALRHAAVLVVLFPRGPDVRFLLTARPDTLLNHPGQVSLPGGAAERGDSSLWHTAVREAQEELGIRTGRLRPLGRLDPVPVVVSNYLVTPFVGWNPVPPMLRPDASEVEEVVEVSLGAILDGANLFRETWNFRGQAWQVTFYRFGPHIVWGATARILGDLAERLGRERRLEEGIPGSVQPA